MYGNEGRGRGRTDDKPITAGKRCSFCLRVSCYHPFMADIIEDAIRDMRAGSGLLKEWRAIQEADRSIREDVLDFAEKVGIHPQVLEEELHRIRPLAGSVLVPDWLDSEPDMFGVVQLKDGVFITGSTRTGKIFGQVRIRQGDGSCIQRRNGIVCLLLQDDDGRKLKLQIRNQTGVAIEREEQRLNEQLDQSKGTVSLGFS